MWESCKKNVPKSVVSSHSEQEFMLSQNLRTYSGNSIVKSSKETKCCRHGKRASKNTEAICELLTQISQTKCKMIKVNIEIINDSN